MSAHETLVAARKVVDDIEARLAELNREVDGAADEFEAADAELVGLLGLAKLGEESDASKLDAARKRRTDAELAVRAIAAAVRVLRERLGPAREVVTAADEVFRNEAAELVAPEHERLKKAVQEHAAKLATSMREFARVDAVRSRIPLGTRAGVSLDRAAGEPFALVRQNHGIDLALAFHRDPPRLSEAEILAIAARK